MTTSKRIREWFVEGVADNQRWMVIICDTFDHEDFPSYFSDAEVKKCIMAIGDAQHGKNMEQLMEVYDLSLPMDEQFVPGKITMHLPVLEDDEE